MTQVLKNRKGVTLVELLAVIVIMGIIAAIAVPAIGGLIENSREKAVQGSITTVEEAARMYAATRDGVVTNVAITELATYVSSGIDFTGSTMTFSVTGGTNVSFSNTGSFEITISNTVYPIIAVGGKLQKS